MDPQNPGAPIDHGFDSLDRLRRIGEYAGGMMRMSVSPGFVNLRILSFADRCSKQQTGFFDLQNPIERLEFTTFSEKLFFPEIRLLTTEKLFAPSAG